MRSTYPIPEGYLMLPPGAEIRVGDKIWVEDYGFQELKSGSLLAGVEANPQRHPCLIRQHFGTVVGSEDGNGLTFEKFSEMNLLRHREWPRTSDGGEIKVTSQEWTISDWAVAVAEETGEICGKIKRLNRLRSGHIMNRKEGSVASEEEAILAIKKEIGDVCTYLDLLAQEGLGSTLEECLRLAYNNVSERENLPHRI